jgi:serine/threonine protein kinase/class 3 adenylate cyclase
MKLGRYRLVAPLGAGRDGLSYLALEDGTDRGCEVRDLATARANPARWKQVVRRLRMAALLRDSATRRLLDMELEHEPPFIALEDTAGPVLAEASTDTPLWEPMRVWQLAAELAGALQEAHRLGLAHGELWPSRVHWGREKGAKLDFSGTLCREQRSNPVDAACAAPELKSGREPDAAADLYALGAILSWLLGCRVVEAGRVRPADFPRPSEHALLFEMADRLLSEDPSERPSATALLEAFLPHRFTAVDSGNAINGAGAPAVSLELTQVVPGVAADAPRDGEALRGIKTIGRFQLVQLIGEGGLGQVYRAEDTTDGSPAAIKVLHPHLAVRPNVLKRFLKEARLLREVQSPFVANILEINEDRGTHYLAMEFIAGRSLSDILNHQALCPRGRLEEAHALLLIIDVVRGLADAHRRGIIHRDIKPQNIMVAHGSGLFQLLEENNRNFGGALGRSPPGLETGAKLCDFGLARHVIESDSLHLTREGTPVGTPLYMSPEQAVGAANLGPATDVYALGATLYHLLAGRPPFTADSALALSLLHAKEPPTPMTQLEPGLSDGICRIVSRCLAKKPEDRYLDADALLDDLERLFRGEPASMALHPRLPEAAHVLEYDWTWELASSPQDLWPYVSNTERLNRAAGIPAMHFRTEAGPKSGGAEVAPPVQRYGSFRAAGVLNAWREHPFEWVEGKRLGVLREYSQGVLKWLASTTELTPRAGGGCTLTHRVRVEPRGFLGRVAAAVEVGFKGRRHLEAVYRRIDAYLRGQLQGPARLDPFEGPARLTHAQKRRLQEHLVALLDKQVPEDVVRPLGDFLENAPSQEVARIRPLALARRLGVDAGGMVAACLHGARQGLFQLLWDILCPLCRIPAGIVETLRALEEHGHCEACQAEFALDFASSVEMIFRVHPEIRVCETRTYCIGGPAHSPHVVAQVRINAGERFDLELALPEGTYRVRGPQLPHAVDFQVAAGAFLSRWLLQVPRDFAGARQGEAATPAEGARLRAGQQRLVLFNGHTEELVVRVERTAQRDDALTAARAAASGLFRELFPGEILESGKLVSVAAVTFLVLDLNEATSLDHARNLYQIIGEARTFALLHDYLLLVEQRAQAEGGAVIKTLGETVLAAFEDKAAAVRAALILARGLPKELGQRWPSLAEPLKVRAGIHHGPAMSATVNGQLDYVGSTVDQAWRLPRLVPGNHLVLTRSVAADAGVIELFGEFNLKPGVLPSGLPGESCGVLLSALLQC